MNRMPELVQRALSALRHLQPADRVTAITILSMWAHAAEIDIERIVNYYFTGGQADAEPGVIVVAAGHVVHPCCGKLDDDAHRNFCAYYRGRSPSEQFLDETMARWSFEDREPARVDSRDGRDERLVSNTDFRDGYVTGYLDALAVMRNVKHETVAALGDLSARRDTLTDDERAAVLQADAEANQRGAA